MDKARRIATHLARFHYVPRIWSFAMCGLATFLLYQERQLSAWLLPAGFFTFVLWPHLAYHRIRWTRDPKRAELNNLFVDALQLGTWVALTQFSLWLAFCFLLAVCLNNLATGGLRQFGGAVTAFATGSALTAVLYGSRFEPHGSTLFALIIGGAALAYACTVGLNYRWQNNRLLKIKQAIESKNQIFQSLLEMNVLTRETSKVEDLLELSLSHIKKLFPLLGFGIIVHEHGRPASIRHALFNGINQIESAYLLAKFPRLDSGSVEPIGMALPAGSGSGYFTPMKGHLKQSEGYLVVQGEGIDEDVLNTTKLFTDQIASALENHLLTEQLKKLANTDALTGLFNRMHFDEEHQRAVRAKLGPANVDFSVVLLDVNGLKEVNDAHGHEVGDQLIVAVAELLKKVSRDADLLVRLGGDEFVVLCHGCDSVNAQHLIARMREAEARACLEVSSKDRDSISSKISFSIGLAGSDETPAQDVFCTADRRMYEDKKRFYERKTRYR